MSMSIPRLATILGLPLLVPPAEGARLCHDLKGLYQPCPEAVGATRRGGTSETGRIPAPAIAAGQPTALSDKSAATSDGVTAPPPPRPKKPPARLCHDLKGLYHPCGR